MLHKILLKRFNFLTLSRRDTGLCKLKSNFFNILVECEIYDRCLFTFPVAFSIKLLDFNNKEDRALLEQDPYKKDFDRDEVKLTDIEIQNIFNYFEWLEKYYDEKFVNYCKQHNIPWEWIEKSNIPYIKNTDISNVKDDEKTDTPFVEEVEINW